MKIDNSFDYSTTRGSTALHQALTKAFFKAVTKKFPKVIALDYTVGMFRAFDNIDRIVRAGTPGVPDIFCLLENGQYLFFDSKTGKASFNANQKAFKNIQEISCGEPRIFKLTCINVALDILEKFNKR